MTTHEPAIDPILRLARRIARRADEIVQRAAGAAHDVQAWLQAEEEILGLRLPPPHLRQDARGRVATVPSGSP